MRAANLFSLLLLCLLPQQALAAKAVGGEASKLKIAAVVDQDAISELDVDKRMRFVIGTSGLSNVPEVLERLRPQVVRALVDEKLQLHEAQKNDVIITDAELAAAIASMEADRGMPPGGIFKMLSSKGVPKDTFENQIRAQLSWQKLVLKVLRPKLRVGNEEIEAEQKKLSAPLPSAQEMLIGLMVLPVDSPAREVEMRKFADKVVSESRRGADFDELARQFGQSVGKVEKFWVQPTSLDSVVARALQGAKAGMVTPPLQNTKGFTIIKVYEVRAAAGATIEKTGDTEVALKEFLFRLKPDAETLEADAMITISQEVAKNPGKCEDKSLPGISDLEDFDIETMMVKGYLSDLKPAIRTIAQSLKVGGMSQPFASAEGIRMYMLCEEKLPATGAAARDVVFQRLMQQEMEKEAAKYMRDLRRAAFIDIR